MKDSKKLRSTQLTLKEQQSRFDSSQSTTSPSYRFAFSRGNTIEDHEDHYNYQDRTKSSTNTLSRFPTESNHSISIQKQMETFKQLPQARDLLQLIPIQFRKKVRQVIKIYEDERKQYQIIFRKMQKQLNDQVLNIQQIKNTQQVIQFQTKQRQGHQISEMNIYLSNRFSQNISSIGDNQQLIKVNQYIQFVQQGFEQTKFMLLEEIENLNRVITDRDTQIKLHIESNEKLNSEILDLQKQLREALNQIHCLEEKNKCQQRKLLQIQKQIKIKRVDVKLASPKTKNNSNIYSNLSVNTTRSNIFKTSRISPDYSPKSASSKRNKSLRFILQKTENYYLKPQQQQQVAISQVDSADFGKEKVIQKRKIRKIFTGLLSATSEQEKKQVLEKLGIQIGLKTNDIKVIFNTN